MRDCTIDPTTSRCTHVFAGQEAGAVAALPNLDRPAAVAASGAQKGQSVLARNLALPVFCPRTRLWRVFYGAAGGAHRASTVSSKPPLREPRRLDRPTLCPTPWPMDARPVVITGGAGLLNVRPFLRWCDTVCLGRSEGYVVDVVRKALAGERHEHPSVIHAADFDVNRTCVIEAGTSLYPCPDRLTLCASCE